MAVLPGAAFLLTEGPHCSSSQAYMLVSWLEEEAAELVVLETREEEDVINELEIGLELDKLELRAAIDELELRAAADELELRATADELEARVEDLILDDLGGDGLGGGRSSGGRGGRGGIGILKGGCPGGP